MLVTEGYPFRNPQRYSNTGRRICRQDEALKCLMSKFENVCKGKGELTWNLKCFKRPIKI